MENKREKNGFSLMVSEITCPHCGEKIVPQDLEFYPACPYCNFKFTSDAALDDFVLSPTIKRWASNANQNFPNQS